MSDRPQFISVPSLTPDEIAAQLVIRWCAAQLRIVVLALRGVVAGLPVSQESEETERMGTRVVPESVSFSLVGTLECLLSDDLVPAICALHEAGALTPTALVRDWQRSQGEQP